MGAYSGYVSINTIQQQKQSTDERVEGKKLSIKAGAFIGIWIKKIERKINSMKSSFLVSAKFYKETLNVKLWSHHSLTWQG